MEVVILLEKIVSIAQENMTILALVTLSMNVTALFIVAYQTHLTRNSLNMARISIDETRKVRQIEALPYVNYIIEVGVKLERWKTKCEKRAKTLEEIIEKNNIESIYDISKQGEKSPNGLVNKHHSCLNYD